MEEEIIIKVDNDYDYGKNSYKKKNYYKGGYK